MEHLKQIADEQLTLRLEAFGVVQIKDPKWCGETSTAEQQAKSIDCFPDWAAVVDYPNQQA